MADHLGSQSSDVWGLIIFIGGLLSGLSIYADAMGVAGEAYHGATGLAFGLIEYLLPVLLCGIGVVLMRDREDNEPGRVAFGLILMFVSLTGFVHLFGGNPAFGNDAADVRGAGGYLGIATAGSLYKLLGPYGTTLVFITLFLMSALVLARLNVRTAIALTREYSRE